MKQTSKRVRKVVRVLYDASPELVSLVNQGANESCLKELKSDNQDHSTLIDVTGIDLEAFGEFGTTTKKRSRKAKDNDKNKPVTYKKAEIHKFVFDPSIFKTEKSVDVFLRDQGYSDFEVTESNGNFEVVDKSVEDFEDIGRIDLERKGVYAIVGRLKTEEAATESMETKEDTKKMTKTNKKSKSKKQESPKYVKDLAKKFDAYFASFSEDETLEEILSAGDDGIPLGMDELTQAFFIAVRNSLLNKNLDGVRTSLEQYGNLIIGLAKLSLGDLTEQKGAKDMLDFEKAMEQKTTEDVVEDKQPDGAEEETALEEEKEEGSEQTEEAQANEQTEEVAKEDTEGGEDSTESGSETVDNEGSSEAEETDGEKPAESAVDEETAEAEGGETEIKSEEEPEDSANLVADVMKALGQLTETVADLKGTLDENSKATKADLELLKEQATKAEERVTQLEGISQKRKGTDPQTEVYKSEATKPQLSPVTKSQRDLYGIS